MLRLAPVQAFVLVAKFAIGASRNDGIAASIGMGIGGVILSLLALTGLHAVFTSVPILFVILKVLGGLYLVYLAIRFWLGAEQALEIEDGVGKTKSTLKKWFLIAFVTQLSNAKTAITYGVIFAALLPVNITSTPSMIYLRMQSVPNWPRRGAVRREWHALYKDCNAALVNLRRSRRASQETVICVVVLP